MENLQKIHEKAISYLGKLLKRIQRLSSGNGAGKTTALVMSDRETEDLFKIAFRNYVKLVDVADSKAGYLFM